MNARERSILVRIADAVDDRDRDLVVGLLAVLLREPRRVKGCACRGCGRRFQWPGLRDEHEARCVFMAENEAAAA